MTVKLDANWQGNSDLDLSIITPQGTRISWMGGRKATTGKNAYSFGREELGLTKASSGTYYIEVNRTDKDTTPITGTISVQTRSDGRTTKKPLRFTLTGKRAVIGQFKSKIERR